jgi:hypothetical protein
VDEASLKEKHPDILETAKKRWDIFDQAEGEDRQNALDDLEFGAGNQWDEKLKNERNQDGRPCLTINRWPQFISQIVNDQRQNRPSAKIFPVDDYGDKETARIYQGLIRHIEYNSNAEIAYDQAFEGAVRKSFGYWHITREYVSPESFDQEILIKPILNDFSVRLDPNHELPDGSDAKWGFIARDIPKEDYIAEYGDSALAQTEEWKGIGDLKSGWIREDTCRVVDYYTIEQEKKTLCLIEEFDEESGRNITRTLYKDNLREDFPEESILSERTTLVPVVKWYKLNGVEVLDEETIPGQYIPIIPVYGRVLKINGKTVRESACRHSKDSQKMYNYWASAETESIALAPRAPFIAAEGQIPKEYASQWQSANRKNHAFLTYKPKSHAGTILPAPQRNSYEPAVAAITNARLQASEDIKATTGIYDAALGNRSNETSGVAIQRRNVQAQTSNFHFIDNLTRSIRHSTKILIQWIPIVYDAARAVRIIGEEGDQEVVKIYEEFQYKGENVYFDLSKGKYDVVIETGPSFATKRQEAAASMEQFAKVAPQLMQIAPDLMVKNMDWPGASELAERLKKIVPHGIIEDKDQKPLPPEVQTQLQQMDQLIQQLTEQLNAANEDINTKRLELESKERIAFAEMETELEKEKLKQSALGAFETVNRHIADIEERLKLVGVDSPVLGTHEYENESFEGYGPEDGAVDPSFINPTSGDSLGTHPPEEF